MLTSERPKKTWGLVAPSTPTVDDLSPLARLSSPVLVERQDDVEALLGAVMAPFSLSVVEGEPGIGKTRLINALTAHPRLEGRTVLVGACQSLTEPFPLAPVIDTLRAADLRAARLSPVAGALRPLLPELASLLPEAPSPLEDVAAERHRTFRAAAEVLGALGTVALVIEDLHWADPSTLDFVRFLVASAPRRVSLVLTYRPGDLPPQFPFPGLLSRIPRGTTWQMLRLKPLSASGVGALTSAILGADRVSREFSEYLRERTAGIPFAVEEVLRLLLERRDLVRRHGHWERRTLDELAVPVAIRDSVLGRAAGLPAEARRIVEAAAVLRVAQPPEVLGTVANLPSDAAVDGLTDALLSGLIDERNGLYGCRHSLARQAVYEALPPPRRRALHQAAAAALESIDARLPRAEAYRAAELAYHHMEGGQAALAAAHAERAADIALSHYDPQSACRFLEVALRAVEAEGGDALPLAMKFSGVALDGLAHERAVALLRPILEQSDLEPAVRGELRVTMGQLLRQCGNASEAYAEFRRALPDLGDRPLAALPAIRSLGLLAVKEGHLNEHMSHMRTAHEIARAQPDRALLLDVEVDTAADLLLAGDPSCWDAIARLPQAADTVLESRSLIRGYLNLAQSATFVGFPQRAEQFLAKCAETQRAVPYGRLNASIETSRLLIDWMAGRWDGLEQRALDLREVVKDFPLAAVDAALVRAHVASARAGAGEGTALLQAVAQQSLTAGSLPVFVDSAATLARVLLQSGRESEGAQWCQLALALLREKGVWAWAGLVLPVAALCERTGVGPRTGEPLAEAATALADRDAPRACAGLLLATAMRSGRRDDVAAALSAWDALDEPYHAALARELTTQDAATAPGDELMSALDTYVRLGADADAARLRRKLRDVGVRLPYPWRGGRRGYGASLSPREQEVVELVGRGATNREIAERLFLSARTVEFHVAKAMQKLGVSSRRELTRVAGDQNPAK